MVERWNHLNENLNDVDNENDPTPTLLLRTAVRTYFAYFFPVQAQTPSGLRS